MAVTNPYIDAQSTNLSSRSSKVYKDLNLNFLAHPVKKDIQILYDVEAIKRSVRNLIYLNQFDKPFHPEIYSGIREFLFEPFSPFVSDIIKSRIESVIKVYEPRIDLVSVDIEDNSDNNELKITIEFYIVNYKSELITLETILERS
jgi:phage baseplate assembly protein W